VAVASAEPYASLHLAPDIQPHQHTAHFFTGRMPFLPPNQQRQSTEGNVSLLTYLKIIIINRFIQRHKFVTSEALGPGSVLVSRERRESLREEECL